MQRDWKSPSPEGPSVKRYLAFQPATSARTEQVFSVASRLISKFHTNLDPKLPGMMFYVAENQKWYGDQMKIQLSLIE
jgi:hypothetical protein